MSNVTPIRPDATEATAPTNGERDALVHAEFERRDNLDLAAYLMGQAVRAAILLIDEENQPDLAADVLRLARDRWLETSDKEVAQA